jgi:Amt family ammonium transporter
MSVEAGITRTKNNISVTIKNISDFSLSVLMYWALCYGLMYGASAGGPFRASLFRL